MEIRILGRDLEVSEIGFGCMGMSHAYGTVSTQKEAEELIEKAIDEGCTFFDTAEIYGTTEDPHHNEKLLGKVLRPYRNKIVLASKCGIRFDETATTVNKPLIPDGRPEMIKASIEGSLMRLNTDHLDLYYIHRIDMTVPIEETAGAMKELMEQGKITHWGLSEASEEIIRRAHKVCPVTAIQNRYSMMYRDYEKLFPVLEELKIGFVAFSPLANGLLTAAYHSHGEFEKPGDYRSAMPQFTEEGLKENNEFMSWMKVIAGTEVKSLRSGKCSIKEAFVRVENGEVYVYGMHITPYEKGNIFNKDPLRVRKLLLHRYEINKIEAKLKEKGLTLVPLKVYFKDSLVKIEIGMARGKKLYDKRQDIAKKDQRREAERDFKVKNLY